MINRRKDWSERQRCSVCSGITSNCVCAFCGRASLIVTGEAAPLTRLVVTQTTPREQPRVPDLPGSDECTWEAGVVSIDHRGEERCLDPGVVGEWRPGHEGSL